MKKGVLAIILGVLLIFSIVGVISAQSSEKNPFKQILNTLEDLKNKISDLFGITSNLQEQINDITSTNQQKKLITIYTRGNSSQSYPVCCPEGYVRTGCSGLKYVYPVENECCVGWDQVWTICLGYENNNTDVEFPCNSEICPSF